MNETERRWCGEEGTFEEGEEEREKGEKMEKKNLSQTTQFIYSVLIKHRYYINMNVI